MALLSENAFLNSLGPEDREAYLQRIVNRQAEVNQTMSTPLQEVDLIRQAAANRLFAQTQEAQRAPEYQLSLLPSAAAPTAAPQPRTPYPGLGQDAVNAGMQAGQQREQLGLFGNMISNIFDNPAIGRAVDRLLEYSMRPEAQPTGPGDTFISQLSRGAYGTRQSELAAQAQNQAFQQKLLLEQVKAGAKAAKPGERQKIYSPEQIAKDSIIVQNAPRGIQNIQEMLTLLRSPGAPVGGAFGTAALGIRNLVATVANVDPTNRQEFEKKRAEIIAALNEQRVFGAQVSQADYDVIEKLILNPGLFTTDKQLRKNLADILNRSVSQYEAAATRLGIEFGYQPVESLFAAPQKGMQLDRQTVTKP